MITSELKHKVRKLKQFENSVRIRSNMGDDIPLVWDKFFDLRGGSGTRDGHSTTGNGKSKALYNLTSLAAMSKDEYKKAVDEFFARVYYEVYIHNGLIDAPVYDTSLLEEIGLSPVADETEVKKRFRDLAKEYHPDKGGDPENFIKLMNVYKKLTDS